VSKTSYSRAVVVMTLLVLFVGSVLRADDWPGWRGPNRDGLCLEKGLLGDWPKEGPKLRWKAKGLGIGHSGPAIVGNVLYTMGEKDKQEWVLAIDVGKEGKPVWSTPIGPMRHDGAGFPGPRSTPTVDGDRVYTLGIAGDLVCLDRKSGEIVWRRDLVKDYGGKTPHWGYAESVLVDGPRVVCTPGGAKNTIVAVDKTNGERVWGLPIGDQADYSSLIKIAIGDSKQYANLTHDGMIGVAATDGKFLWRYAAPANVKSQMRGSIPTCIWTGDTVFGCSGYGCGGGLARIVPNEGGFKAEELWFTKKMENHHGGVVLVDGYFYGCCNPKALTCLDYKTGEVKWTDTSSGKGSILYADGRLYYRSEKGPISLVEATPDGFKLHGRFDQPDHSGKQTWAHPVIANGALYIRDQDVILAYEVKAGK
jgi:outer membrane protein assembly factor BamB